MGRDLRVAVHEGDSDLGTLGPGGGAVGVRPGLGHLHLCGLLSVGDCGRAVCRDGTNRVRILGSAGDARLKNCVVDLLAVIVELDKVVEGCSLDVRRERCRLVSGRAVREERHGDRHALRPSHRTVGVLPALGRRDRSEDPLVVVGELGLGGLAVLDGGLGDAAVGDGQGVAGDLGGADALGDGVLAEGQVGQGVLAVLEVLVGDGRGVVVRAGDGEGGAVRGGRAAGRLLGDLQGASLLLLIGNLQHVTEIVDVFVVIGLICQLELEDRARLRVASRRFELDQIVLLACP